METVNFARKQVASAAKLCERTEKKVHQLGLA
jgi:hypothetical protein